MKQLILPKRPLPPYVAKHVQPAIELAYGFLCAKYGWKFGDVILSFSMTASRSVYFDNSQPAYPHRVFGNQPVASIVPRSKLYLYEKNSIGQFKQGVDIGFLLGTTLAIIHELTHHVQFRRGRQVKRDGSGLNKTIVYSELETTANELEFLKISFPEEYQRVMIEENTRGVHHVHA